MKFCKDCRHSRPSREDKAPEDDYLARCVRWQELEYHPVTGSSWAKSASCVDERGYSAIGERFPPEAICGPDARFWESKV